MLEARTLDAFRREPEGGFVGGGSWIYFCFDRDLFGFMLFGRPSQADMAALVRLMTLELDRAPHAALADVAGVEMMPRPAFETLIAYVAEHGPRLSERITRAAVVRSSGFNGALASGFFGAAGSPFTVSFHADLTSAFVALESREPAGRAAALAAARAAVQDLPEPIRELRLFLERTSGRPAIGRAAAAAGCSVRTLQRTLAAAGTSYAKEVQDVRVSKAERLLLESDESITWIAFEVGCSSPQQLSALFKRTRGLSPSAYRTRRGD
jgi:AraC-like DNA-binding protein